MLFLFCREHTNFHPTINKKLSLKKSSTMTVTRRSADLSSLPQSRQLRKRKEDISKGNISKRPVLSSCTDQNSRDLLHACLSKLQPNIWYSVVPSPGNHVDISSGTKQKWDLLFILLLQLGLIGKNNHSKNGYTVYKTKWDDFVACLLYTSPSPRY